MKHEASNKTPKRQWWKIAGFALGILLIAAAATYALTTRNSAASSGPLGNGNVPSIGSNTSKSAPAAMGVGDLKWVKNLATKFTDHDFIFVIMPGSDSDSTETLANRVSDAAAKIETRGARVETITLSASDSEFSITMERLAITQLPAVLAIAISGNGAIMTGDITEGKLLQTYLVVSQPVCAPGSSPGCCP
ncbi:MAG: hypothetical protein MUO97_03660 [Dehalococcoidia bacterium]|nr:hypothetical protein [Dehalococcoidia bacterium]